MAFYVLENLGEIELYNSDIIGNESVGVMTQDEAYRLMLNLDSTLRAMGYKVK